jgi:hypothetical protein
VPYDDDLLSAARNGGSDVLRARSRRQPLVGLGFGPERFGQLGAGLARPQQRAREDRLRPRIFGPQPLAERTGLFASLGSQRPQIVGISRGGFGVSDEVEAHGARG